MNEDFAEKHYDATVRLAKRLAALYKFPDAEEFESIAVYELGVSCSKVENPSWKVVVQHICSALERAANKYHQEKKDRAEYGETTTSDGAGLR